MLVKYSSAQAIAVSCCLLVLTIVLADMHVSAASTAAVPVQTAHTRPRVKVVRKTATSFALTTLERQAGRLQKRMASRFGVHTTQLAAVRALNQRSRLMAKSLTLTFMPDKADAFEIAKLQPWTLRLQSHPDWVSFRPDKEQPSYVVNNNTIARTLDTTPPKELYPVADTGIISPVDDNGVLRVTSSNFAHPGFTLDAFSTARTIEDLLSSSGTGANVPVTYEAPSAYILTTSGLMQELSLLSTGRSDFQGSPSGREKNIQKALHEEVTDILVPPHTPFSFNDTVKESLAAGGWHMALAIFEGGRLEYVPGGGICQAATTVYRAALLAGLPILKQRNHSLYVSYYAKYGVGMDATIYPGEQDLIFMNDTNHYLLIQSSTEGTEAVVHFYGVPDGRSVAITGPYLSSNAPDILTSANKPLAKNEIAWKRTITKRDGTSVDEIMVSRYKSLPKH